jgi:hypothetical protein
MPTCIADGIMRGIILERRKADDGKFRRCGAFGTAWRRARKCSGCVVKTLKALLVWRSGVLMGY